MASKKDMRRADLAVPYVPPVAPKDGLAFGEAASSTLPMAAIFTRNKMIGWAAVMFTTNQFINETPAQKANAQSPAIFSVGMSLLSLGVTYMPLFLPPVQPRGLGQGTAPVVAQPVPLP